MTESIKWGFSLLRMTAFMVLAWMVATSILDTSKTAVPLGLGVGLLFCVLAAGALGWEIWTRSRAMTVTSSGDGWQLSRKTVPVCLFVRREIRHPNLRNRLMDLWRVGAVSLLLMLISIPLYAGGGRREALLSGGFGLLLLATMIRDTVVLRTITAGGHTLTLRKAEYERLAHEDR